VNKPGMSTIYKEVRACANNHLAGNVMPSSIIYSVAAAMFDRSNKTTKRFRKEFFRKAVNRLLDAVKTLQRLEEQYYG